MWSNAYNYLWGSTNTPDDTDNNVIANQSTITNTDANTTTFTTTSTNDIRNSEVKTSNTTRLWSNHNDKITLNTTTLDDEKQSGLNVFKPQNQYKNSNSNYNHPFPKSKQNYKNNDNNDPITPTQLSSSDLLTVIFETNTDNESKINDNNNNNSNDSSLSKMNDPFYVTHYVFGGGYTNIGSSAVAQSYSIIDNKDKPKDKEININNNNNGNNDNINTKLISNYFDTLGLTLSETDGLMKLHNWVKQDRLSQKMCDELCLGDLILAYFSSFSPTNPDCQGCWKRWMQYRYDTPLLKDVNYQKIEQFLATGIYSIAFTNNKNRPVWVVNTQYYDSSFGPQVTAKATMLFLTSFLWNLSNNQFDFNALRYGIDVYINLSHWSMNMLSWRTVKACKDVLTAFPFAMVKTYVVNTPTFLYLAKQFATKVFPPHTMDKIVVLKDMEQYFEICGVREKTPICCGGTLKLNAVQWMKQRGYLESVNPNGNENMNENDNIIEKQSNNLKFQS